MENENEEIVDEVLEQTNESENTDTQTVEQNVEEIQSEEKKSFKDLLKENPDYQNELKKSMKVNILILKMLSKQAWKHQLLMKQFQKWKNSTRTKALIYRKKLNILIMI